MIEVKINSILEDQGKSLYWLAQTTELSYPTVHRLATGKTSSINFDTLGRICLTLNVRIQDVLKLTEK